MNCLPSLKVIPLILFACLLSGCASQKGKSFDQKWENMKRWENEQSEKMWDRIMG